MASTPRAPKQWVLQKNGTVNSFESWKQNLLFTLKLEPSFASFLAKGAVWEPDSEDKACRSFVADADPIPEGSRLTAEQKLDNLELMLGQIGNYVGVISRNSIIPLLVRYGRKSACILDFNLPEPISFISRNLSWSIMNGLKICINECWRFLRTTYCAPMAILPIMENLHLKMGFFHLHLKIYLYSPGSNYSTKTYQN